MRASIQGAWLLRRATRRRLSDSNHSGARVTRGLTHRVYNKTGGLDIPSIDVFISRVAISRCKKCGSGKCTCSSGWLPPCGVAQLPAETS